MKGTLGSMVASLHRVKKFVMLKLVGQAYGQDVMVMIDLGGSHNFIDINFMERKELKKKRFEGFRISNANGKLTLVNRIMENLGVRLQGYVVRENLYIYPLKGYPHIILEVQWLFELGVIHTNYRDLTMWFEMGGIKYTLQGIRDVEVLKFNNQLNLAE